MTLLQAALSYASRGWAVFPLRPGTKLPATTHGCKDASVDPHVINTWWTENPDYGIGVATGSASGLVVLDFDKKTGGLETWEQLSSDLPTTMTVATQNGGAHLYFSSSEENIRNKAGLLPGMDVRGEGGYVVAPPTPGYSLVDKASLVGLPFWLSEKLRAPKAPEPIQGSAALPDGERGVLNKRTLRFVAEGARPGMWHQELFQAAMNCKQNGYSFEECVELLSKATGFLDETHDMPQLRDVYNNRTPQHPPALSEEPQTARLLVRAGELTGGMRAFLSDKAKVKGEPTGIPGLDKLLGGGQRLGEVTCWHAEAKTGKNTLWHKLMHLWLSRAEPIPIAYASRELTPESEVLPNLLSLEYRENTWLVDVRPEYDSVVAKWPLYFAEGYGYFALEDIRRWVSEAKAAGVHYFFMDHLHYMLEDPEDHKAASKLIKELKTIAKQENVCINIIIQPNKLMDGQRLSLNSIKGGAAMGQAIDNLLILERVRNSETKNVAKLTLEVARSKLAKQGSIYLQFDSVTTDFIEVEGAPAEPDPAPLPARPSWEGPRIVI